MNDVTQLITAKTVTIDLKKHGAKFLKWTDAFLSKKSDTYGNATQSAMKVYNCKNYNVAGVIASKNLSKVKSIGLQFVENEGMTVQDWYKILAAKALKGTYEQTVDFMQRLELIDKDSSVPANQLNQQFNFGDLANEFAKARKERGLEDIQTQPGIDSSTGSSD